MPVRSRPRGRAMSHSVDRHGGGEMGVWVEGSGGVSVAGIGLHRYQFPTQTPYPPLGLTAVRAALADAGLAWQQVQSAYIGTTSIGMAAGPVMLRHLGAGGLAVTQVENASAS